MNSNKCAKEVLKKSNGRELIAAILCIIGTAGMTIWIVHILSK